MQRQPKIISGGFLIGLLLVLAVMPAQSQQAPIPQQARQVPGPPPGTAMTKQYVQMVGRLAYFWGWPLVNMANRAKAAFEAAGRSWWEACRWGSAAWRC